MTRLDAIQKEFPHDGHTLLCANNAEARVQKKRQRTVVMIRSKQAVARIEGKRVDQLETACRKRFKRIMQQRSCDTAPTSRGGYYKADDYCGLKGLAG
jgi:hypothetical protein